MNYTGLSGADQYARDNQTYCGNIGCQIYKANLAQVVVNTSGRFCLFQQNKILRL